MRGVLAGWQAWPLLVDPCCTNPKCLPCETVAVLFHVLVHQHMHIVD